MPQFDTFIFSSILFYFIVFYFIYLYFNFNLFLPRLSSILKLRFKLLNKKKTEQQFKLTYPKTFLKFSSYMNSITTE